MISQVTSMGMDMENRDPNNLNPHLQVMWDDIIGEPEGLRTPDCCWNCSVKCYNGSRSCCYIFLVAIFAPIISCLNGIQFACVSFNHVWCVGACLRIWKIQWATLKKFWEACLYAICLPASNVFGAFFSKIKVKYQKLPEGTGDEKDTEDFFNV